MNEIRKLQQVVAQISARMVRSSIASLDDDILQSFAQFAPLLRLDRVALVSARDDSPLAHAVYVWCAPGIKSVARDLNLVDLFPWEYEVLIQQGRMLSISKLSDYPPEGRIDRKSHKAIGTRSLFSIPLMIGQRVGHVLVNHSVHAEQSWSDEEVSLACMLGEIFVSALQRRESEIVLQTANERLNLAVNAADIGLWDYDADTGHFWVTGTVREHFNFEADQIITLEDVLLRVVPEDRPLVVQKLEQALESREEVFLEYRLLNGGGKVRWVHTRGRVSLEGAEQLPRLRGVTLEVTARKELELELQKKISEVQRLGRVLEKENEYLRFEAGIQADQTEVLGTCERMRVVMNQVHQVARTGSTVLLLGETGTGKGLIAQTIHRLSERGKRPMIKVNCAALPGALVESELFGREKGAFTGALSRQRGRFDLAHGSTLFLDEIAEMSLETQAKLLRVLQDGEFERLGSPQTIKVDVRLIVATNRNLEEEVEHGRFRRDLFYRLNVFPITVPPLRERTEDIPQLVWEFVSEFGERMGKKMRRIASRDMQALQDYPWPGNIRELRNVIEHSLIVSTSDTLQLPRMNAAPSGSGQLKSLEEVEKEYIQFILKTTRGRIKGDQGAADLLRMNPSTLYSRMRKLGISLERA
jgi:transcriptional regulator with GAF, ATPase, and Fis domain